MLAQRLSTFDIVGIQVSADPVSSVANMVNAVRSYRHGYPEILAARFRGQP